MSFLQRSKKIHVDIDPSSIGKNIKVDLAIVSDVSELLKSLIKRFKEKNKNFLNSNKQKLLSGGRQLSNGEKKKSLNFINSDKIIKPQHAVQRLYELTKRIEIHLLQLRSVNIKWAAQTL